jgi:hypothetical protein
LQSSPVDDVIEKRLIVCRPSFRGKSIDRTLGPIHVILTRSAIRVIDGMKTLWTVHNVSQEPQSAAWPPLFVSFATLL